MIPEIGHFALILALCMALLQGIMPLVGSFTGNANWIATARPAATAQFMLLIVSYAALKTPTAVATYIIDKNAQYESEIVQAGLWISQLAKQNIEREKLRLEQLSQMIKMKPGELVRNKILELDQLKSLLMQATRYSLKELKESVLHMEQMVNLADPKLTLKRGFVMLKKDNKIMTSIEEIAVGEKITIEFNDGNADAEIIKKN